MNHVYFGHHKCASTWLDNVVRDVSEEHGYLYRPVVDHETPTAHGILRDYVNTFSREELGAYVREHHIDVVGAFTADWSQVEALRPLRGVHIVRDPRDIIVSGYFSHRNTHPVDHLPHMKAHRERLKNVTKEEGLFLEMEYVTSEMNDFRNWKFDDPDILELKMEEVTARPYESFMEIFRFWGLLADDSTGGGLARLANRSLRYARKPLRRVPAVERVLRQRIPVSPERVLALTYHHRFEKKTAGRSKGTVDAGSHYRKGKAGDWSNHFTDEHVTEFKKRFGDLVVHLGYEQTNDWTAEEGSGTQAQSERTSQT